MVCIRGYCVRRVIGEKMEQNHLIDIVKKVKQKGADEVDILLKESDTISVTTRLTKLEKVTQASIVSAKIRVSIGKKSATVSTDNISTLTDETFLEKAVASAKIAPEDDSKLRPEIDELCRNPKNIDMCDRTAITAEQIISASKECEEIALGISGITNSEGADIGHAHSKITLVRNEDFLGQYEKTINQFFVVTLAEKNGELQRDYDFSQAVYYADLKKTKELAEKAAERTLKKLGARKIKSCKVPVVFEKNIAGQLLSSLLDSINGAAVAKGISFLKDKLSKKVFSSDITITDLFGIDRGLRSRPFDSDGIACRDTLIVENGVLNSFLLNTKYAHQLGMRTTGNCESFTEISPHNVVVQNGKRSFFEIIKDIKQGLFVTEVMGNGLNMVTGNYSQGAAGFWIENGEISYPVHEITIAGNFADMLGHCEVASDLEQLTGIDSPTLAIEEMVVGGI